MSAHIPVGVLLIARVAARTHYRVVKATAVCPSDLLTTALTQESSLNASGRQLAAQAGQLGSERIDAPA